MTSTRICNTPGCGRGCPSVDHAYCDTCVGPVLRTGRPPEIERREPFQPEWLRRARAQQHGLAKDLTRSAA